VPQGSFLTRVRDLCHVLLISLMHTIEKPCSRREGWTATMYSRTQNENGTYNTMCLDCFLTVATSVETETDLELLEMRHMCPEKALAQMISGRNAGETHAKRQ
jgi:hypothetical protein